MLPENPDEEKFRQTARELGIDEDKYIKALKKMCIRDRDRTVQCLPSGAADDGREKGHHPYP